jgi:hypothetical protein
MFADRGPRRVVKCRLCRESLVVPRIRDSMTELAVASRDEFVTEPPYVLEDATSDGETTRRREVQFLDVVLHRKSAREVEQPRERLVLLRQIEFDLTTEVIAVLSVKDTRDLPEPRGFDGHVRIDEDEEITGRTTNSLVPCGVRPLNLVLDEYLYVICRTSDLLRDRPRVVRRAVVDDENLVLTNWIVYG